jgi:hypothetical protein
VDSFHSRRRLWLRLAEERRQNAFATKECTERKERSFFLRALLVRQSLPDRADGGGWAVLRPLHFRLFPAHKTLKISKNKRLLRRTHSILPLFDGNANTIIQLFVIGQSRLAGSARHKR